jgi:hypothetical protein
MTWLDYIFIATLFGVALIFPRTTKINRKLNTLLMKADEAIAALTQANETLGNVSTEVTKVGTETQKLLDMIGNVQNQDLPPALADQITAIATQAGVVKTGVQAVDDLVPDQP